MKNTRDLQWEIRRTLSHLTPVAPLGHQKIRVGGAGDGGYVMIDLFDNVDAAYSLGIGGDVSWDLHFAELKIPVFQFDHTINAPPIAHPLFSFFKKGIGSVNGGEYVTLLSAVEQNGHSGNNNLLLKMDIEDAEWEALSALPDSLLLQFQQIVIEYHGLLRLEDANHLSRIQCALERLRRLFHVHHVHANNWARYDIIAGIAVPDVIEVSYIRRSLVCDVAEAGTFPTPLDFPCHPDRLDIVLGSFQFL